MESSESKLGHPGDDFLLVVMRRCLKAVDCLEDFVVVGVAEDARQGNILVGLFGGEECTLYVEMPIVEVEGCDDMQENKEFLAGRGR